MWNKKKYLDLRGDKKLKAIVRKNKELRKKLKKKDRLEVARTLP